MEVLGCRNKLYGLITLISSLSEKEGTTMNVIDRIILGSLAFGIWAWVLITFLSGQHVDC